MPISANDIRFYYSGGASNANPAASLGGVISNTEVFNDVLENVFDNVTKVEADNGDVEFRCIYIKNTGSEVWKNLTVYLQQQSLSEDDSVQFGIGTSAINGVEQTIADENTSPVGIIGSNANTLDNGFLIGDLAPASHKAIWLARRVDPSASTFKRNKFIIRVQVGNPAGGGTGGGGGTPPPQCPSGYTWDSVTQQCIKNAPDGGGTGGGGGTGTQQPPQLDSNGIAWFIGKGQQYLIDQSRTDPGDFRWSGEVNDVLGGYEVTAIVKHTGVAGGGHMALKHWGPHHCGSCGNKESGSCCCWYDTGIRANGDTQFQVERPHPDNTPGNNYFNLPFLVSNIGVSMGSGTYIGLKWIIYPITYPGGTSDNGGIKLKLYADTDALNTSTNKPNNNWVLLFDVTDTGQIMGNYSSPSLHDVEMRISDTSSVTVYGGGLHVRKIRRPDDLLPGSSTGGGGGTAPVCPINWHWDATQSKCIQDTGTGGGGTTPNCPSGQHWDSALQRCVGDTSGGGGNEIPDFTMTAVGDFTCGSNAQQIMSRMTSRNPEIFIQLGDYTYTSSTGCWIDMTRAFMQAGKIKQCVIGNHDDEEDESNSLRNQYLAAYNLQLPYHSFNFRNVHVLTLYTWASYGYGSGSAQYEFARNDLQAARANPAIDWIIVCFHKPIYAVGNDHPPESAFRDLYHPLFDQFKVDIMLTGHNHNYERTLPIKHGGGATPIATSTNQNVYADLVNPIHFTVGTGGRTLDGFSSKASFAVSQVSLHGYLHLVWTNNGKKLTMRFYDRSDVLKDECVVSKGQVNSEPPPSGGGGTVGNNDVFGIRKLYPTKASGDEFFLTNLDDTRFSIGNAISIDNNGESQTIQDPNPRLLIFTQGNGDTTTLSENDRGDAPPMQSFNYGTLASLGYWYQARDWKNVEFTVYFNVDAINSDVEQELELVVRSVLHDENVRNGCGGASYHCCINYIDGTVRFKKEERHAEYEIDPFTSTDIGAIGVGRWIGLKGVVYNRADNGHVEMEIWVDKNNTNTWTKYHSKTDTGVWGDNMDGCGASSGGAKITWGSPMCMIKWNENDMRVRYISVREITPPK